MGSFAHSLIVLTVPIVMIMIKYVTHLDFIDNLQLSKYIEVSVITCSLESHIDYLLCVSGSSLLLRMRPTPAHTLPDSAAVAFNTITANAPIFPQAKKAVSNSTDLATKLVDPSIISIRAAKHSPQSSHLESAPAPESGTSLAPSAFPWKRPFFQ